ncbi:MAG: esterase/lipase family protein, partial [Myxococcaceae bacterium]
PVSSHPTASILHRAKDLYETIAESCLGDDGPIHILGHSTGGLDARYLLSPSCPLGEGYDVARFVDRVRSVVCISTPHQGTPLASFFLGLFGQRLLQLLSLFTATALRHGRIPLSPLFKLTGSLLRADDVLGFKTTLLDELFEGLLSDFSPERQRELTQLLAKIMDDQSLIRQLTADEMERFNARTLDRSGVRYASVLTRALSPRVRNFVIAGLDPYAQATHLLYTFLHRQSRGLSSRLLPALTAQQEAMLRMAYQELPDSDESDGIVPTRSQPYGQVLCAVTADHLDVLGHYDGPNETPQHVDWLVSGSGFTRQQFEAVWTKVLQAVL